MALTLRLATLDDEEAFFRWRHADEEASPWWKGVPVEMGAHQKWFRARLDNPAVQLFVAEVDGVAVGDARIDSTGEITFNILPEHQQQGLGTAMVRALTALCEEDGWTRIRAVVDDTNIASIRTLEKAGYRHRPDVWFYRWPN